MPEPSFAESLAGLDEASLTTLLQARPDACLQPVPRGFAQLAQRLGGADSLVAALHQADRDMVVVGQAVAALAPAATVSQLARVLSATEQEVAGVVDALGARGLAWTDGGGTVRLPDRLEGHWQAEIGGGRPLARIAPSVLAEDLRAAASAWGIEAGGPRKQDVVARLSAALSDVRAVADVIATLSGPARRGLAEHRLASVTGYPVWRRPGHQAPADAELAAAGLLLPSYGRHELPKEVAAAAWLAELGLALTGRPEIATAVKAPAEVRGTAQAAVRDALRQVTTLLDHARGRPVTALKRGGVGPRERTRLGRELVVTEDVLAMWIDLAHSAGLLGRVAAGYAPTPAYRPWRAAEPGVRWAALADAWLRLPHAPTEREIDDEGPPAPPLPVASAAGRLRRALLRNAAPGASVASVAAAIDWFGRLHGYPEAERNRAVAAAIREGELLGVLAADVVTELGAHLAAGEPVEQLGARCARLLPAGECSVVLQSDLTAVVSGEPPASVAELLAACADVEARGSAGVWRFGPGSVRRALDAGWTSEELLAELRDLTGRDLPQPLEYLITDAARRHGHVRVRDVRSCVVADEATTTELLHTRALRGLELGRLAPTVLASPCGRDEVITRLRAAGLSPVAEDGAGAVIVEPAGDHEAPEPFAIAPLASRDRLTPAELAARLAADPHGDTAPDTATTSPVFAQLADLNPHLDDAELALLTDAVERQTDVLIAYRDKNGSRSVRAIQPQAVYGRWLDSWCHLRNAQRDFTVANIESVAPAR